MKRHRLTTRERVAVFRDNEGRCHICGGRIDATQAWEVSHEIPLELGGADDASNWRPAHKRCHRDHTAAVDIPNIARAKRREAKHLGIRSASRPMPGGRDSPIKHKVGGGRVWRATGEPV